MRNLFSMLVLVVVAVAGLNVLSGCGKKEESAPAAQPAAPVDANRAAVLSSISAEETKLKGFATASDQLNAHKEMSDAEKKTVGEHRKTVDASMTSLQNIRKSVEGKTTLTKEEKAKFEGEIRKVREARNLDKAQKGLIDLHKSKKLDANLHKTLESSTKAPPPDAAPAAVDEDEASEDESAE